MNTSIQVPELLKSLPNWVQWKLAPGGDGRMTKVPFVAGSDFTRKAAWTRPTTWTTFDEATKNITLNHEQGVGFVVAGGAVEAGIVGFDIDGCRNPQTGDLAPWAEELINELDSYTEVTPSQTGVRVWAVGKLPEGGGHVFHIDPSVGWGDKVQIEMYDRGRYFTVTADPYYDETVEIETRDLAEAYQLCANIAARHPVKNKVVEASVDVAHVEGVKIEHTGSIITSKLELLMRGNIVSTKPFSISDGLGNSLNYPSHSEADLSLCTELALKFGDQPDVIWDEYTESALCRNKWIEREADFRTHTIAKAIITAERLKSRVATKSEPKSKPATDSTVDITSIGSTYSHPHYAMTDEEIEIQRESDCPIYRLHPVAGPDFDETQLYGVLGHVAKKMCQFSEAHIATVYLNLIVSFGNMIKHAPYFNIANTKHYTNEFLACVGDSSRARKGVAGDAVAALIEIVDHDWFTNRNCGGISTQQGLLSQIKDPSEYQRFDKRKKEYVTVTQPGVTDKRLCIREGELSNVFKIMSDPNNRAGETIRNAWDSKVLSNLVAGKTEVGEHNSLICRYPHVSIVGSTTPSLVKSTLPIGADKSGDGSRFIWCYTKRTQLSPTGGPEIPWAGESWTDARGEHNLIAYLVEAVEMAKKRGLFPLRASAKKYWNCLYERLETDPRTGFLGGMTARAAGHIRRIAMILALMEQNDAVDKHHLEAAEAIWDYSQESARYIFKGYSLDQSRILDLAEKATQVQSGTNTAGAVFNTEVQAGVTVTDVHNLFGRNKTAEWVRAQLADLVERGYLIKKVEQRPVGGNTATRQNVDTFWFKKS